VRDAPHRAPLLEVSGLDVTYPQPEGDVRALTGIDFSLGASGRSGLLGESGCGKTTLAMAIAGILPEGTRVSGSIRVLNRPAPAASGPLWRRRCDRAVAMVFQEPRPFLNPVMRVADQVAEVCLSRGQTGGRGVSGQALRRVGLDERTGDSYPHQLSGGECQRVAMAQALAAQPELLIADEPTSSLDACAQAEILALLAGLLEEAPFALLLVSHNPAVLARMTSELTVMYAGQIVERGPTLEVMRQPLHPYTRLLLACYPDVRGGPAGRLPVIPGAPDPGAATGGCRFAARCPERLDACSRTEPPLLDRDARQVRCLLYDA